MELKESNEAQDDAKGENELDDEDNALLDNILNKSDVPTATKTTPAKEYDVLLDDLKSLAVSKGPGTLYELYARNEKIAERLKFLNYESEFVLLSSAFKVLQRHYFVKSTNVGEQFFMFTSLATWLIRKAKIGNFEMPHEFDDPNSVLANILDALNSKNVEVSFGASKLKSGSGAYCIFVLDRLTAMAFSEANVRFERIEAIDNTDGDNEVDAEESATSNGENIEITAEQFDDEEEEIVAAMDDDDEDDENYINNNELSGQSLHFIDDNGFSEKKVDNTESTAPQNSQTGLKPILHTFTDLSTMEMELRRVIPQLKITIRSSIKNWKMHLDQIKRYQRTIDDQFNGVVRPFLVQNAQEIGEAMNRISSREAHLNAQFDHLAQTFRIRQNEYVAVNEKYRESSGTLIDRAGTLNHLNAEIEQIKQQIEEQGIQNTNGAPILKIKQALTKLESSIFTMRVQIVAAEQALMYSQLSDRLNITGNNEIF